MSQCPKFLLRCASALKKDTVRCQIVLQPHKLAWREPVSVRVMGTRIEYMRDIDHGVPGNRECELCLVLRYSLDTNHDQCADVQYRRQRRQPGLIAVLRAVVCQHRIR